MEMPKPHRLTPQQYHQQWVRGRIKSQKKGAKLSKEVDADTQRHGYCAEKWEGKSKTKKVGPKKND